MDAVLGISDLSRKLSASAVAIGNFDGVHLGHRAILNEMLQRARENHLTAVVYTFRPHPRLVLHPESLFGLLSTYTEREKQIAELEPDLLIEEPFVRDFSTISAGDFFSKCL